MKSRGQKGSAWLAALSRLLPWAALAVTGAWAQMPAVPLASPTPVRSMEYDANGNLTRTIQVTVPAAGGGLATRHTYDALNRRVLTTDARNGVVGLSYTAMDDLALVVDPIGGRTEYLRDGLGQLLLQRSPDTGPTGHTYDAAGRLITRTDARSVVSTFTYDAIGRPTSVSHAHPGVDTQLLRWNYDEIIGGSTAGVGYLTSMSGPGTFAQFTRDPLGRVVRHLQRTSAATATGAVLDDLIVDYAYDGGGNVVRIKMPSGRVVSYVRSGGLVQSISVAASEGGAAIPILSQVRRQPFGSISGWQWHMAAGSRSHVRVFDSSGRLVRYPLGTLVRDVLYDAADCIASYTHYDAATGASQSWWDQGFAYDELGRLTGLTWGGTWHSITYDANGNRLTMNRGGPTDSPYTYQPGTNRMLSAPYPHRSFGYDAAGNPTVIGVAPAQIEPSGRLSYLSTPYGNGRYHYDAMGRRVIKVSQAIANGVIGPTKTTLYVYDQQDRLLGEYAAGGGGALREYVWLDDTPVAMLQSNPTNASGAPAVYHIHADHLDTPRMVLDRNGAPVWWWLDEPFGQTQTASNVAVNLGFLSLRMPGQVFDEESGLHYNFHRYYDPSTGRYTQSDPIGLAGGINTYAYVGGNPVSNVDPTGLLCNWAQATGTYSCYDFNGNYYATGQGYAGAGPHRNQPGSQNVPFMGPLPRGCYKVTGIESGSTGPYSLRLSPQFSSDPSNSSRDLRSFLIHGDSRQRPGAASQGCPIMGLADRRSIPLGETFCVN